MHIPAGGRPRPLSAELYYIHMYDPLVYTYMYAYVWWLSPYMYTALYTVRYT